MAFESTHPRYLYSLGTGGLSLQGPSKADRPGLGAPSPTPSI